MGIPRLTQDLSPYAETAIIGESQLSNSPLTIRKLVIDGPSLVYHVYNAILQSIAANKDDEILPSYALINACFLQFLDDLNSRAAQISAILFDGALPRSKRSIRQDRLERTRQNLDNYRKVLAQDAVNTASGSANSRLATDIAESSELRTILWSDTVAKSTSLHLLPPPPFMVASVIEHLQTSKWASITRVVPGEADEYCASEAARHGSAVMSNDSDLLLYNLGTTGAALMLKTIQLISSTDKHIPGTLVVQCLRPSEIASLLNVPNILSFAFRRSQDPSSSTSIIAQRAREKVSTVDQDLWIKFQRQYLMPEESHPTQDLELNLAHPSILGLDPRTSELVCSCIRSEPVHMYLPVVLEDPTRDSCWSYSVDLRQLACSILLYFHETDNKSTAQDHVVEHARRGSIIAEYQVQKLNEPRLAEKMKEVVKMFGHYSTGNSTDMNTTMTSRGEQRPRNEGLNESDSTFFKYHLLASEIVVAQRISNSKSYQPSFSKLFPPNNLKNASITRLTWEDIHMHATIQCTLYSLRILKQISEFCMRDGTIMPQTELWKNVQLMSTHLADMPAVAELFLNASSLRRKLKYFPPDLVASSINEIIQRRDPAKSQLTENEKIPQTRLNCTPQLERARKPTWQKLKTSNKKRRSGGLSESSRSKNIKPQNVAAQRQQSRDANSFSLLQDHETSSGNDD